MRRFIIGAALPLLITGCQGTSAVAPAPAGINSAQFPMTGAMPAQLAMSGGMRMQSKVARFSDPIGTAGKAPPAVTWIFAANGPGGNVDVYDAAKLTMISTCPCSGVGLAVDPRSGDLAVGASSGSVTVWHVKKTIVQFASLKLSQGPYAVGIAYDGKGDIYAANAGDNVIDFFSASLIKAGGGSPTRTISTTNLVDAVYLAATKKNLVADGDNQNGQPIIVSINPMTGADAIVQQVTSGTVPEGIVFDKQQNLVFNDVGNQNTLEVFKKPWTGAPIQTFNYGSGAQSGYYAGISLNATQDTLWAGNFTFLNPSHAAGNLQANSYPLGSIGSSTPPIASEYYDSIAADPQAKL